MKAFFVSFLSLLWSMNASAATLEYVFDAERVHYKYTEWSDDLGDYETFYPTLLGAILPGSLILGDDSDCSFFITGSGSGSSPDCNSTIYDYADPFFLGISITGATGYIFEWWGWEDYYEETASPSRTFVSRMPCPTQTASRCHYPQASCCLPRSAV